MINRTCRRIALTVGGLCAGFAALTFAVPVDDPDPARFEAEIARFLAWDRKNALPKDPILFVGSSSIRLWPTRESFPDLPVINRGFGGSHMSDAIHYIDKIVLPYDAPIIVLYEGDNDVASGKKPERILADFKTFVKRVRDKQPEVHIVFLAIKPSPSRWKFWQSMRDTNAAINNVCEFDPRLTYLDVATPLLKHGREPNPAYYVEDNLHLSPDGYDVWTKTLRPLLERLVKRGS